jgi:hypothetical protein
MEQLTLQILFDKKDLKTWTLFNEKWTWMELGKNQKKKIGFELGLEPFSLQFYISASRLIRLIIR